PLAVAEVRGAGPALHVARSPLRLRDAPVESRPPAVAREAVQVLQAAAHEERPRRGRAGQVLDGVVELEEEEVRELADVLETLLGLGPLAPGLARLADGD